jgi:hypothetical protein
MLNQAPCYADGAGEDVQLHVLTSALTEVSGQFNHFILTRNPWNILNDVKVIPSISLEGDHRILTAEFRKVAEKRSTVYQEKKN